MPSTFLATPISRLPSDDTLTSLSTDNSPAHLVRYRSMFQLKHTLLNVYWVSVSGEGSEFTMISEEVESQAHHCNKKKKSSKTVEVNIVCHVLESVSMFIIVTYIAIHTCHVWGALWALTYCCLGAVGDERRHVLRHIYKGQLNLQCKVQYTVLCCYACIHCTGVWGHKSQGYCGSSTGQSL